jgi:hypothetical protein
MSRYKSSSNSSRWVLHLVLGICAALIALVIWNMIPQTKLMDSNDMVMTVNDHIVYPGEFRFYVNRFLESYLPVYGEKTFSQKNLFSGFLSTVSNYVVQNYVMLDWAEENGFTLTDEMKATAREQLDEYKASFDSEEAFQGMLSATGLSEDTYLRFLEMNQVLSAFNDYLYDSERSPYQIKDEELLSLADEYGIYGAEHIYFDMGETDDEKAANREKCEKALARLNSGENFEDLMNELSEDPGLSTYPNGYTFGPDSNFDPSFYAATQKIEVGQYSEIITSADGYHIIKRIDPNPDEASYLIRVAMSNKEFADRQANAKVVYSPRFGEIEFSDFHAVTETAE